MSPSRELDHTADWALHVWAPNLKSLFADAARGMFSLAGVEVAPGRMRWRQIGITADDYESLLVAWLQELLYLAESEGLAFDDYRIAQLSPGRLEAEVHAGRAGPADKLIKAATFNDLAIRPTAEGYEVTLVFDV